MRRLGTGKHQWTPKRLERYLQAEFWSLCEGWLAGYPQSSFITIKHYNTRVFLPYMDIPSGHKFCFTIRPGSYGGIFTIQSYGRSYGGIVPVFIEFTGKHWGQPKQCFGGKRGLRVADCKMTDYKLKYKWKYSKNVKMFFFLNLSKAFNLILNEDLAPEFILFYPRATSSAIFNCM